MSGDRDVLVKARRMTRQTLDLMGEHYGEAPDPPFNLTEYAAESADGYRAAMSGFTDDERAAFMAGAHYMYVALGKALNVLPIDVYPEHLIGLMAWRILMATAAEFDPEVLT